MSKEEKILCIHCNSDETFMCLAHKIPEKRAYRCKNCNSAWSKSEPK